MGEINTFSVASAPQKSIQYLKCLFRFEPRPIRFNSNRIRTVRTPLLGPITSVAVPPTIVDKDTSTDMVVRESSNVTLTCKAHGYPEPYVMWRREDGEDISYNGEPGRG